MLSWVRKLWALGWGPRGPTNPVLGVLSAGAGLFCALVVGTAVLLKRNNYEAVVGIWSFLQESVAESLGLDALAVVAWATLLVLGAIVAGAMFGGVIVYCSDQRASYVTHAWRGALAMVGGIALYLAVWTIMSVPEWLG